MSNECSGSTTPAATRRAPRRGGDRGRRRRCCGPGGLVAFPTETVYGLGADATVAGRLARLYAAKGRPRFNPLIAHFAEPRGGRWREGLFSAPARALAERFWPGPLTLVVPVAARRPRLRSRPRRPRRAWRCGCPPTRSRRRCSPRPAARSRRRRPTAPDVSARRAPPTSRRPRRPHRPRPRRRAAPIGIESTIVACLDDRPRLLRPGGVAREAIEAVLGRRVGDPDAAGRHAPIAPGMLASHYAPRALRAARTRCDVEPGEAVLDFGGRLPAGRRAPPTATFPPAATRGCGHQPVRLSARPRRDGRCRHRGRADPRRASARRSTTGWPARRRRADGAEFFAGSGSHFALVR